MPTPTNLFIEIANQKGITSPSDQNPIVPPDVSAPGLYNFNLFYLDYVPGGTDTYHRYATAAMELNVRSNGPPLTGTFTLSFLGYATAPLDINATQDVVASAFVGLRSVGPGNAIVTGNKVTGWTIEFTGNRAGLVPPELVIANASGCAPTSTANVVTSQIGGLNNRQNARQFVRVLQNRVATTNSFTEINSAGPNYGWTTASGLDTSGIGSSFFSNPAYDVVLEANLYIAGNRSGADGVISSSGAMSGTDGVTYQIAARSGTDGSITGSAGRSGQGRFYATDTSNIYSKPSSGDTAWVTGDANRPITSTGGYIPANCYLGAAYGSGASGSYFNIHQGSPTGPLVNMTLPGGTTIVTWTTGTLPSNTFTSSSAAFVSSDVGRTININGLGYTISLWISSTTITLSSVPPAIGSSLTWSMPAVPTGKFTSASATFAPSDVSRTLSGASLAAGTTIATWVDANTVTLSQNPTAFGTGQTWSVPAYLTKTYTSATAAFTSVDVGQTIVGTNLAANTTISAVNSSSSVTLSQLPTATGTGLGWTIIKTIPGSGAAPVITTTVAGSSSSKAIQRITFLETPAYGYFTLTQNSVTSGPVQCPINTTDFTNVLNEAFLNAAPFSIKQVARNLFDITFGQNGAQSVFTCVDGNVIYDNVVMTLLLAPGVGETSPIDPGGPPPPPVIFVPVNFDGDFSTASACGELRIQNLGDGTGAIVIRQRYMQLRSAWAKLALNSGGPLSSYLIGEDGMEDLGGGIVQWDRSYATLPKSRTEAHNFQRPFTGISKSYLNGQLFDQQLWSISVSHLATVYFYYTVGHSKLSFSDSPAGTMIHFAVPQGFNQFPPQLLYFNGFDPNNGTFGRTYNWTWSRRRWMGDIWEHQAWVA